MNYFIKQVEDIIKKDEEKPQSLSKYCMDWKEEIIYVEVNKYISQSNKCIQRINITKKYIDLMKEVYIFEELNNILEEYISQNKIDYYKYKVYEFVTHPYITIPIIGYLLYTSFYN